MKYKLAVIFALTGWIAVIAQYILLIQNRNTSVLEATIRFISYFTILTNTLVAIYFSGLIFIRNKNTKLIGEPGTLTAITIYITMVGLVYQFALRSLWQPTGLQLLVNELLHSVIPVLVIIFWYLYEVTKPVKYSQPIKWAFYPLIYLLFILIRGSFSNFYPYPFIDVSSLGITKALVNAGLLVILFIAISAIFLFIGKAILKR